MFNDLTKSDIQIYFTEDGESLFVKNVSFMIRIMDSRNKRQISKVGVFKEDE